MKQFDLGLVGPALPPSHWRHKAQVIVTRMKKERPVGGGDAFRALVRAALKYDAASNELVDAVRTAEQYTGRTS